MGLFKKEKTDMEIIDEWIPKIKKFSKENNCDVGDIGITHYSSGLLYGTQLKVEFRIK